MKDRKARHREILRNALPPEDTSEYSKLIEKLEGRFLYDKKHNEFVKRSREKVFNSLEAQMLSNCDLVTEISLRQYLEDFNNRAWFYGLRSMPLMFNILEAFLNFRTPEIYFELIEEENYLISFFDFIDFITSKDFEEDKKLIDESITNEIIYNFNVGDDLEKIKFKSGDGQEFVIAGVSIIRRGNEITMLMIAGRKKNGDDILDKKDLEFRSNIPGRARLTADFKERVQEEEYDYIYLDKDEKYIKSVVACRVDLETMTIDARYIAEETSLAYGLITDEIDETQIGKLDGKEWRETLESLKAAVEIYNPIFEALKLSLYLPYYFNHNEDLIVEENLETHFKKLNTSPISKRKYRDVFGYKASVKALYSLNKKGVFSPDIINLRDDLFRVETGGYWKKLEIGEIGLDKNGNPIHGRTWVNLTHSWFESTEDGLVVEKEYDRFIGENAGFIYILRNPAMGKNIFKIGLTRKDVDERAKQLSKTSVPDRFLKSHEWNVRDCVQAEKIIHEKLDFYRVDPRREFFNIDYEKAIAVISEVINEINAIVD
ncbi:GIY-YIG nuclease family protein [Flavobacterium sp. RHBU_3]|uniref:GIY-YIG nuclease family protein n=1 Tax=Flavobacterium sp. RHBU_3 TaxID=3391184 RepID=UPI003984FDC0